jgi:hypothetical protein
MGVTGNEKPATMAGSGAPEGDVADSKDLQQQSKTLDKLVGHVEDRQLDSSRVQPVCFWFTQHYPSIDPLLRCITSKIRVGIGNLFRSLLISRGVVEHLDLAAGLCSHCGEEYSMC